MARTTPVHLDGPLHAGTPLRVAEQPGVLGIGGRWYRVQTTVDAWGRSRTTARRQPGRVLACFTCQQVFWFHDPRGRWCEACCARRRISNALSPVTHTRHCPQCGALHHAQRTTRTYCSPACRQAAYRQRQGSVDNSA